MKKLSALLILIGLVNSIQAQSPQKMSYQCVVRNASGNLVAGQSVGLRVSIMQGSSSGTVIYQETYNPKPSTNANGLLTVEIGSGTPSLGTFSAIDWSSGTHYLKTETDPAGGTNYTINGTSQLLSVPYSLYSSKAGNGLNLSSNPVSGDILYHNGTAWQLLSKGVDGQTLSVDKGLPKWGEPGYSLPLVTTSPVSGITQTSAKSGGTIVSTGYFNVTAYGVCWSTSQNPTIADNKTTDGSGIGSFTSSLTGLLANTVYYVRAYATNSADKTAYGNQVTFPTLSNEPGITTRDVTNILETQSIAGGTIISDGGAAITERGVCYGTSVDPTINDKKVASGSGLGAFTVPLTILIPNTLYYVRAYAVNTKGVTYGDNKSFKTEDAYYTGFEEGIPSGWIGTWIPATETPFESFYSLKSVNPGDSVTFTRTIANPSGGQVSFYHRALDGNFTIRTNFYIDNVLQATLGSENWIQKTFIITSGSHKFKWVNLGGGNNITHIDYFICTK